MTKLIVASVLGVWMLLVFGVAAGDPRTGVSITETGSNTIGGVKTWVGTQDFSHATVIGLSAAVSNWVSTNVVTVIMTNNDGAKLSFFVKDPPFESDASGYIVDYCTNTFEHIHVRFNPITGKTNIVLSGWDIVDFNEPSYVPLADLTTYPAGGHSVADRLALFTAGGTYAGAMTYGNRLTPAAAHTFVHSTTNVHPTIYVLPPWQGVTNGVNVPTLQLGADGVHLVPIGLRVGESEFVNDPDGTGANKFVQRQFNGGSWQPIRCTEWLSNQLVSTEYTLWEFPWRQRFHSWWIERWGTNAFTTGNIHKDWAGYRIGNPALADQFRFISGWPELDWPLIEIGKNLDAGPRIAISAAGTIAFSSGQTNGVYDVWLGRDAAGLLKLDGSLTVTGTLKRSSYTVVDSGNVGTYAWTPTTLTNAAQIGGTVGGITNAVNTNTAAGVVSVANRVASIGTNVSKSVVWATKTNAQAFATGQYATIIWELAMKNDGHLNTATGEYTNMVEGAQVEGCGNFDSLQSGGTAASIIVDCFTNGVVCLRSGRAYNSVVTTPFKFVTPPLSSGTVVSVVLFQNVVTSATNNLTNPERTWYSLKLLLP